MLIKLRECDKMYIERLQRLTIIQARVHIIQLVTERACGTPRKDPYKYMDKKGMPNWDDIIIRIGMILSSQLG